MKLILRASVVCALLAAGAALNPSTLTAMRGLDDRAPLASMRGVTSRLVSGIAQWLRAPLAGVASYGGADAQQADAQAAASVTTDKADYRPGETAIVTGSGFGPSEEVTLQVTHTDGTAEGGAGHEPWTVWTGGDGSFTSSWYVEPDDSVGATLLLTAAGSSSGLTAQTTFTDAPAANLDQCRNGEATTPNNCLDLGGSVGWVNGNAGPENSHYTEGLSIPYRVRMTELPTGGTPVTIEIGYDIKHSDKHALDFLTHYQRLNPHTGFGHAAEPLAGQRRRGLLRPVHAARHEALAVGQNDVLAVTPRQRQQGAVRRARLAEEFPRLH